MVDFQGEFEIHLTASTTSAQLPEFQAWCLEHQFKCVQIVLARGDHVEQPMATWRRGNCKLSQVVAEAERLAQAAHNSGLKIVRIKVEAAPWNQGVPLTMAAAANAPEDQYFEHHVKLLRNAGTSQEQLLAVCERHQAHVSRNAFRKPAAGKEERFVTLRSYRVSRKESLRQLSKLLADLDACGEKVIEQESEYCVYDSNLALDAGWLPSA